MHRSVRLVKLLGSLFVVGLFASSCVVSSSDDDDECDPGTSSSCTCANGSTGTRTCLPSGSGWGACGSCSNASAGSSNSGGSAGDGSGGQSSGGTYGGAGEGGASSGGTAGAGEGGASTGGMAGAGEGGMSQGGAGGEGGTNTEPQTCDECALAECQPEWDACGVDGATSQCAMEYNCIAGCMEGARLDLTSGQLLSADQITMTCVLEVCDEVIPSGGWSGGATQETHDLLDCLAGKTGWEGPPPHWDQSDCRDACFGPLD